MSTDARQMKPIWYFAGLMLATMGAVVFIAGVYYYFYPNHATTALAHLHPNLWWGAIMVIAGVIFLLTSGRVKAE